MRKYDNRHVYYNMRNEGFEIKFYNNDGDLDYIVSCLTFEEVGLELTQWVWAMGTNKKYLPTVWKNGLPYRGEDILATMEG
jgi:hypothetical protein